MKTQTVDHDEYMGYIEKVSTLSNQLMNANGMIKKLEDELLFIKSNSDGVLVVVKEVGKPEVFEFKSTEKQVLSQLVGSNDKLLDIYKTLNEKLVLLEFLIKEQEVLIEKQSSENTKLNSIIENLKNRTLIQRIQNKV